MYIYIYEVLNLFFHRPVAETTLPSLLPVTPSFASCLLPFCGVFRFRHPFGMFLLSTGRGNTHLTGRGNMCGNAETEYGVFHSSSYYFCVHTEVRNKLSSMQEKYTDNTPRRLRQPCRPRCPRRPCRPCRGRIILTVEGELSL